MMAGVATDTIVVSTRIMKKPRQSANSAGHGSCSSWTARGGGGGLAGTPVGEVWVTTRVNTSSHRQVLPDLAGCCMATST